MNSIQSKLDKIFEIARLHPFYEARYAKSSSFSDAPLTDKSELYHGIELLLSQGRSAREGIYLSPTGGSVPSKLLYFPTDVNDNERQRQLLSPWLNKAQIFTESTIALNMFGSNLMYRALEIFNDFCQRAHATVLPAGSKCPDQLACSIAGRFGADTLIGNPSRVLQFARYVESNTIPLKFDKLIWGGEALQQHKADYLKRVLGLNQLCAIYGSAEAGIWGYQPHDLPLNCYIYPPEIIHIEIIAPDEDGFGNMILTNLVRTRNPLCRYESGDVGRITSRILGDEEVHILEFKGRIHDSFQVGSEYYSISDFQNLFRDLLEYQVRISFDPIGQRDVIEFFLVAPDLEFIEAQGSILIEQVRNQLQSEENLFTTKIEFVEIAALKKSSTSQKVVRIVDER